MYRTDFWTLWEKRRVGCFKRTALKHVYYLGWNRSPAQVGCMRQVLGHGALGRPRGSGWRGRWEGRSRWGTHVNPWLFHFNIWQNPLQKKKEYRVVLVAGFRKKKYRKPHKAGATVKDTTTNTYWYGYFRKGFYISLFYRDLIWRNDQYGMEHSLISILAVLALFFSCVKW